MPVHDMGVHKAQLLVAEGPGQGADDVEAQPPVQFHRRRIGAHYVIELHGPVAGILRLGNAVLDKRPPDPPALRFRTDQVGGARHMRAAPGVVGPVLVHAHDAGFRDGGEGRVRPEPVRPEGVQVEVIREWQGVAYGNDRLAYAPHRIEVGVSCLSDLHGVG